MLLHIKDELSAKLEQKAASAKTTVEIYTQELLEQAMDEEDDLDLAVEAYRQGGKSYSSEEVRRELGLDR